jgi:hypothetical protein
MAYIRLCKEECFWYQMPMWNFKIEKGKFDTVGPYSSCIISHSLSFTLCKMWTLTLAVESSRERIRGEVFGSNIHLLSVPPPSPGACLLIPSPLYLSLPPLKPLCFPMASATSGCPDRGDVANCLSFLFPKCRHRGCQPLGPGLTLTARMFSRLGSE